MFHFPYDSDRLNLPSVLVLNSCGITCAGDEKEIAAFCAHVSELDLSDNKLEDWHEVKLSWCWVWVKGSDDSLCYCLCCCVCCWILALGILVCMSQEKQLTASTGSVVIFQLTLLLLICFSLMWKTLRNFILGIKRLIRPQRFRLLTVH